VKALSIQQPWADLIVRGLKDVENRTWATTYRGPLLIHAGRALQKGRTTFTLYGPEHEWDLGGIIGMVDLVDCVTDSKSPWAAPGRTHFVVANPRRVPFHPVKGMLGLFEVPWPPATTSTHAARRDERPGVGPVSSAEPLGGVEHAGLVLPLPTLRRLAQEHRGITLPGGEREARPAFMAAFGGLLHLLFEGLTMEELGLLIRSAQGTPGKTRETMVSAWARSIGGFLDEDLADGPYRSIDDDEDDAIEMALLEDGDEDDEGEDEDATENQPRINATRGEVEDGDTSRSRSSIDDVDVEVVMAAFRQVLRDSGDTERAELLRAVARQLGFSRLGARIEEVLRGHLRAAIRRRIARADGDVVCVETKTMADYELETLRAAHPGVPATRAADVARRAHGRRGASARVGSTHRRRQGAAEVSVQLGDSPWRTGSRWRGPHQAVA